MEPKAVPKTYKIDLRPLADVYRKEDVLRILVDLPGARDEGDGFTFKDGHITSKADSKRSESNVCVCKRVFRRDHRLNTATIEAVLQHGVLKLSIPFHEEAHPPKIEIKACEEEGCAPYFFSLKEGF